jgi:hypothetical protein
VNVYTSRRKGNTSHHEKNNNNHASYGEQRRRSETFVVSWSLYSPMLKLPTGSQWRQELRKWLASADPSTNHIISCGTQHKGTAKWFFRGSLFEEWRSTASLLWIHGKRMLSESSPFHSDVTVYVAGSGKSVLWCAVFHMFSFQAT